jgi:hypothetical protein
VFTEAGTEGTGSKFHPKKRAEVFKDILKGAGIERNGLAIVFMSGVVSVPGPNIMN